MRHSFIGHLGFITVTLLFGLGIGHAAGQTASPSNAAQEIRELKDRIEKNNQELEEDHKLLTEALRKLQKANNEDNAFMRNVVRRLRQMAYDLQRRIDGLNKRYDELKFSLTTNSGLVGKQGGGQYNTSVTVPPHSHITSITVTARSWVNSLGFLYDGEKRQENIGGGEAADDGTFDLNGNRLVGIQVTYQGTQSIRRMRIKVVDSTGRVHWSGWYGNTGGYNDRNSEQPVLEVSGKEIVGIAVEGDHVLNRIGIITRDIEY